MAGSVSSAGSASSAKKPRRERTSVCSFCNMTFNKKEHLQRHERTHTLDRPYICDFPGCGKTFARRDTLTRHTRLHKRDDGDVPDAATGPSSSAPSSLRVPKPAKKRRARNGSATTTLAHDDSTENEGEEAGSSSPELDAAGEDDVELDHKLPAKRLQSMTIAHAKDSDDEEEKSEFGGDEIKAPVDPADAANYTQSAIAAAAAIVNVASEEPKPSFYNWNRMGAGGKDAAYLVPHSPPAGSSLGLDIALPATAGPASFENNPPNNNNNNPANELPGLVQATQHDFRIFRPITGSNDQPGNDIQQHVSQPPQQHSPVQQPGWQQQSFLAGSPGSTNFAQLPQLHSPARGSASLMNAAAAPLAPAHIPPVANVPTSPVTAPIHISPPGAYQSLPLPIPQPPHMQHMPNPGHRARQFSMNSMDYSPMDAETGLARSSYSASPASVDSFLSMAYTGSSPHSVAGSLPPMPAPIGAWDHMPANYAGNNHTPGGDMPAAFKKANNAFTQPLTMGIGLHAWLSGNASNNATPVPAQNNGNSGSMWGRTGVDSDSKKHLYMLMRAAEAPADEFLRWPSRDSSPAFGQSTSAFSSSARAASTLAKSSLALSTGSDTSNASYIEFGEYDSTQSALFGDAVPLGKKDMAVSHSPIASLEQWLGRHTDASLADSMVF